MSTTTGEGETSAVAATRRPLRILHVIDGIGVGGAEHVLLRLVEQLQAAGHRNVVVSLMNPGRFAERLAAAGATVEGLGFAPSRLSGLAAWRLRGVFQRHQPDIVQGWMYHGNLAALVGRWIAGCGAPLVWSVHNTLDPPPAYKWFTNFALRLNAILSRQPAGIIYVSKASAVHHERRGFRRAGVSVIPNGTDCGHFRPDSGAGARLRTELGLGAGAFLVGLFARWDPMKDHANLLKAARILLDREVPLHVVLAGSAIDDGNADLAVALAHHHLRSHVSLLGERQDVRHLVAGLDVFALSSAWGEAFPLVLGEAMASGVPCVATDVGDCAWIIDDTGVVVPPGDSLALANALQNLLNMSAEERQRMGAAARRRVLQYFSLYQMVRQYEDFYLALSARAKVKLTLPIELEERT